MKKEEKTNKEDKKLKGMKEAAKIVQVITKITQIAISICAVVMVIAVIALPILANKIEVTDKGIEVSGEVVVDEENFDKEVLDVVKDFFEENTPTKIVIYGEVVMVVTIVTLTVMVIALKNVSKLFKNISEEPSPFSEENTLLTSKIAKYGTICLFVSLALELIVLTLADMEYSGVGFKDIILVGMMYVMVYIFEYGYAIETKKGSVKNGKKQSKSN